MAEDQPERLPHLPLQRIEVERPRHKSPGRSGAPRRENREYGQQLEAAAEMVKEEFRIQAQETPPEFDPALIFRLQLEGHVDEDEWRKSGLTLLSEEPDRAVVLFSEDQLAEFQGRLKEYSREIPVGQKGPRYAWLSSIAPSMSNWSAEDRIGKKLSEMVIDPEDTYRLDVEVWRLEEDEGADDRLDQLGAFVDGAGGEYLDDFVGPSFAVARVAVPGLAIEELANVGVIKSIDLPPQPDLGLRQDLLTPIEDFTAPIESPDPEAPRVCVVDSGVAAGHPLLGPAVADERAVPASLGNPSDANGHGTMMSGVVLYGDVRECIRGLDFEPKVWLCSARVTNDQNRFDDRRLVVNQMDEAIRTFFRDHGCRVFSISLGDPALVYSGGKPSGWAQVLDTLIRELDLIIVVSVGNIPIAGLAGDPADALASSYPSYLFEDEHRIIEPATAACAITVGSLAHSEASIAMENHPDDPAYRCLARINQPSPFSRCGPGVNGAVKPDVVEYGGNLVWDGHARLIRYRDAAASITSTFFHPLERLFATEVGTSLSAAKVAYLAGTILGRYPGLRADLVRALIANSAEVPTEARTILDDDEALHLCGYGLPDTERALFSTDHRVTMFAQDRIPVDAIHIYEIPMPDDFRGSGGWRRITVTLAFSPPVRHTRLDYIGVKMRFRLFRGLETDRVVAWHAEHPTDADPDKIERRYQLKLTPSPNRRDKGTLQKAQFKFRQDRVVQDYGTDRLLLLVKSESGWVSPEEYPAQDYSLVVTVEDLEGRISIYNAIRQRVRVPARVRVRP